ncbi:MAG: acetate uptake transporter [Cellulomonas sp.]|jgi:succinate-acetate transporter protein|nr:acetate uptake transporter [Cellulomonas sp.]
MTTNQPAAPTAIADPGPLGLAAFALSTFVLSLYNAGILEGGRPVVVGLALFYGGLAQLLAGMWEFRTGNTFGALAFTSYGAFWLAWATWVVWGADKVADAQQASQAIGVFLLAWGLFTAYMTVAALRTTTAVLTVFVLLTATFFLLGIGDFAENATIVKAGGFVGLATALAAWYGSFAGVVNSTFSKTVLPVGPRS